MSNPAILLASPDNAARIEEILGLWQEHFGERRPGDGWGDLEINVPMNDVATATVTFHLTEDQLVALAALANRRRNNGAVIPGTMPS